MIHSVLRELERIDGANGLSEAKKDMDAFAKSASLRVGNLAFFRNVQSVAMKCRESKFHKSHSNLAKLSKSACGFNGQAILTLSSYPS